MPSLSPFNANSNEDAPFSVSTSTALPAAVVVAAMVGEDWDDCVHTTAAIADDNEEDNDDGAQDNDGDGDGAGMVSTSDITGYGFTVVVEGTHEVVAVSVVALSLLAQPLHCEFPHLQSLLRIVAFLAKEECSEDGLSREEEGVFARGVEGPSVDLRVHPSPSPRPFVYSLRSSRFSG